MATTTGTRKRSTTKKTTTKTNENVVTVETKEKPVVVETKEEKPVVVEKPQPRQFNQHDLILCRSVTAGWLGCSGKSGQYYIFENFGDECELEYQDLFALKQRRSPYLYAPLFVIEDEELLDNPRWADVKQFYYDKVYTMDDINQILNVPISKFENTIKALPKGLAKSLQVEVAKRIENGTFDSLNKIKIIDEVFDTDFKSILA